MPTTYEKSISESRKIGYKDKLCRKVFFSVMNRLGKCQLSISEQENWYAFGDDTSPLKANITIHNSAFFSKVVLGGSIGAGESYMDGDWSTSNLTDVVRLFAKNLSVIDQMDNQYSFTQRILGKINHWSNKNTLDGSKKNISAHYDLSNVFFGLFLDDSMMYSSAIFNEKDLSLNQASKAKLERICRQLQLDSSDHLLEIGTGWGGMAIYAAQNYGCHVTTTTISDEQFQHTKNEITKLGLQEKITVLLDDYRNLHGKYDKLVSIEMVEAVGHQYLDGYFKKCSSLLKNDGLMLIQAITIPDQRYDYYKKENDFIKQYIFPGGHLPSLARINRAIEKHTDLQTINLDDIGYSYAMTLKHWHQRFMANKNQIMELGFDQRFVRMWQFYFSYCEGGFLEQNISTTQILFAKPHGKKSSLKC